MTSMPDPETYKLLGEIKGGQDAIQTMLGQHRKAIDSAVSAIHEVHQETTQGFGDTKAQIATINTKLEGQKEDINRSHSKIETLSAICRAACPIENESMSRGKQAGIVTGILTGLAALGTYLANALKGE